MKITINEEKLLKTLEEKWGDNATCPFCHKDEWMIDRCLVSPVQIGEDGKMIIGKQFQPLISVVCKNCGNTVLLNGLVLKCLDKEDDLKENDNKGEDTIER